MVKNFEDMFIRFDVIHERDGQTADRWTDGQTLHNSKDRACIASRSKNAYHSRSFNVIQRWRDSADNV